MGTPETYGKGDSMFRSFKGTHKKSETGIKAEIKPPMTPVDQIELSMFDKAQERQIRRDSHITTD